MVKMTSINLEDETCKRVKEYNKKHSEQKLIVCKICDKAINDKIDELEAKEKAIQ